MIYQNVELHNIAEVKTIPGWEGVRLQRVPEDMRVKLNPGAQERYLNPDGGEIRFVCDGEKAVVTLSSAEETDVIIFNGLFQAQKIKLTKEKQEIELSIPERLAKLDKKYWKDMPFSPNVYRLVLGGPLRSSIFFHGAEGEGLKPPEKEQLPKLRYLAYGTSITHGAAATAAHLCYAAQTARRLGADLINLGVGGSAHCEKELSNYIAGRTDWHMASLALSVNMVGGFSLEEFYNRVSYMVNTVAGADISRPVACITLFPYGNDFNVAFHDKSSEDFRQKLRDAVTACPHPNVHLIEGPDILTDIGGLTPDMIHPGDNGMIQMGENLARKLKPLLI